MRVFPKEEYKGQTYRRLKTFREPLPGGGWDEEGFEPFVFVVVDKRQCETPELGETEDEFGECVSIRTGVPAAGDPKNVAVDSRFPFT